MTKKPDVVVVGGGFAGCEAAWAAANAGCEVLLYEMRPQVMTPAHQTDLLAELVCSNSFKSRNPDSPPGQLKEEMRALGSLMIPTAERNSVPGGEALSVDRVEFAKEMTEQIEGHPRIKVVREEFTPEKFNPDTPTILATGPLTSPALSEWLKSLTGQEHLYFYDAVSPTVTADSINRDVVWEQSRYDKGDAAYLNCPMDKEQYERFVDALLAAEQVPLHDFEKPAYFEGCLPIEEIARRGRESLRFSNFKPVGLTDPRTGKRPYAVVQLRPENREKTLYSLVACQTRLKWGPQKEVLRLIPGLEEAEFVRLGVVHRNTYVDSPRVLNERLMVVSDPDASRRKGILLAGQITGVEGYVESGAIGILAGLSAAALAGKATYAPPPRETALGSLMAHITNRESPAFAPMNINWGLFPPPAGADQPTGKKTPKDVVRKRKLEAARVALGRWMEELREERAMA
ncbi:MAG: methylenetetrahydrofolate--tRNA-(uracil-5-)-methyltransferase TrmFO [Fimbriimonadales bacterium]|nr:MAG: methylenetetrahydrofolate--tRNA-(uracil-5-)-methyltransferase TrmFO [Fimbriimonadales bacterium]